MAIQKTEAILLRRQEIRETSLVLTAFSRNLGKFQGLVKGVRGSRAAVPWYLEPLTLQAVVLYERKRSPWVLVSTCDLVDAFEPIRRDLTRTAYATFCLDLVDAMTGVGDPHPEIFDLLLLALRAMGEKGVDLKSVTRFVEAHLLKFSGLLPSVESLAISPEAKDGLRQILGTPFLQMGGVRLGADVERQLRRAHQGLFHRALERELRSRTFLNALGLEWELS